jgi:hypothetical protein
MVVSGGSGDVVGRFKAVQLSSGSALAACPFLANQRAAFLETQLEAVFLVHSGFLLPD